MWISKKKDERKNEFISTTLELFIDKGYENTSINDILKAIGITKGSFYHNFKSKDDLLNEIIVLLSDDVIDIVKEAESDVSLSAIEKLRKVSKLMVEYRSSNTLIYKTLESFQSNDANSYIARRYGARIKNMSMPLIARILGQGVNDGEFQIEYIFEATNLYIDILSMYKKRIYQINNENLKNSEKQKELEKAKQTYINVIAGLLGTSKDWINFLEYKE